MEANDEGINTDWRKVAIALYKKPVDSKIFGSVEIDITDLELFIAKKRKEGLKITPTHIFTLAVARSMKKDIPSLNTYIKRGDVVSRKSIDALVSVLIEIGKMSSVKIKDADKLTLSELSVVMGEEIKNARKKSDTGSNGMIGRVSKIPWPFRIWLVRWVRKITIDWGFSLPLFNLNANSFGSFMISNIGTLGLDVGYPALFPLSNIPFVLIMGGINKKPFVVNDEIKIRRIISLGIAIDHRLMDAMHGGELFRYIKEVVRHPEVLETKPK